MVTEWERKRSGERKEQEIYIPGPRNFATSAAEYVLLLDLCRLYIRITSSMKQQCVINQGFPIGENHIFRISI